jgi:hypothetical protein
LPHAITVVRLKLLCDRPQGAAAGLEPASSLPQCLGCEHQGHQTKAGRSSLSYAAHAIWHTRGPTRLSPSRHLRIGRSKAGVGQSSAISATRAREKMRLERERRRRVTAADPGAGTQGVTRSGTTHTRHTHRPHHHHRRTPHTHNRSHHNKRSLRALPLHAHHRCHANGPHWPRDGAAQRAHPEAPRRQIAPGGSVASPGCIPLVFLSASLSSSSAPRGCDAEVVPAGPGAAAAATPAGRRS